MKGLNRFWFALVLNMLWIAGVHGAPAVRTQQLRAASGVTIPGKFSKAADSLQGQRPLVNAGNHRVVALGSRASLSGTAVGFKPGAALQTTWTKVRGPGNVVFADHTAVKTTATFSTPGSYVLQLSATDGTLSNSETVEITVQDTSGIPASLTMTSDPGDYIGGGQTYNYTNQTGTFGVSTYGKDLMVSYNDPGYVNSWDLEIGGPEFGPLQLGTYTGATRAAFRGPTEPGLDVSGNGRGSNTLTGSFVIKKIIYGANGTVVSLWATFEQHSEGAVPALRGEIKYNVDSTATPVNQAPATYAGVDQRIVYPATANLSGLVQDDGLPIGHVLVPTWSQVSGPGTTTFSQPSALQTTASFSVPGQYVLQLSVSDGLLSGSDTVTITVVDPSVQTSLVMTSDAGDYIGQGQTYSFDLTTGSFSLNSSESTLTISYGDGANQWWDLDFATPGNAPFTVGTYTGAARAAFKDPSQPGLDVSGDGRGSNTLTASFTVKKVIYGPSNNVVSFWATFEQHSEGATPALRGEVKYNAQDTDPSVNQPPSSYAGPNARVVLPNALALAGLAADDGLPNGTLSTAWSVVSGPGTVTFGDSTSPQTSAAFSAAGNYVLALTASDGVYSTVSKMNVEVVDASVNTSLTMTSDAGDYIGQGKTYNYNLTNGDFTATYSGGVMTINYSGPSYDDWTLQFAAPYYGALTDGYYSGAARYPFQSSNQPGLSVYGEGRGSNTLTGNFTVKQIVIGTDGSVSSFWATFEQHSEGATPALRGEIKINVSGANSNQPPIVNAGGSASVLLSNALVLAGTAADDGLPNGTLTSTWSMVSGPGTVTFGDPSSLTTSATFSAAGAYVLALTVSDGQLSAVSNLPVIVIDPNNPTSLTMTSDSGDWIGQGKIYNFDLTTGIFSATYSTGVVSLNYSGGGEMWTLNFAAPYHGPLVPGTYTGAVRYPFQATSQPGLDIDADSRGSNTLTGTFVVKKAIYGANGKMASFWATFEQHSEGAVPALRGEIKFNAGATDTSTNQPPGVYAGADSVATLGRQLSLSGAVTDDGLPGAVTITWSQLSGPGVATFANPASVQTTVTFSAAGQYVLQLAASDGQLSATSSLNVNVVDPNENTSLVMTSDAGDYIGAGQTYDYTPYDGVFSVSKNYDNGVSIDFNTPDYSHFWYLDFAAPGGATLTPGTYNGAVRFPFQGSLAGLDIAGDGRGSNTLTGSFVVKEIQFNADGSVASFWVTFEQHSEGETPALHGEFKYRAPLLPIPDAGSGGATFTALPVQLNGSATVGGQPAGPDVSYTWSEVSGPVAVWFSNAASPNTTAIFPIAGTYVLQLTASNSSGSSSAQVTYTVTSVNGTYDGILLSGDGSPVGVLNLQMTLRGTFSAKLQIGDSAYHFAGMLGPDGTWQGPGAARKNAPWIELVYQDGGTVSASIFVNGQTIDGTLQQVTPIAGTKFPKTLVGMYAFQLSVASGEVGWGTVSVNSQGQAVVKVSAPDGLPFVAGGTVSADGKLLINTYLKRDQSDLAGTIQFPLTSGADVNGTLYWGEPLKLLGSVPAGTNHPPLVLHGAKIVPVNVKSEPLTGSTAAVPVNVTISGFGSDTQPLVVPLILVGRNSVQLQSGSAVVKLQSNIDGLITGSILDPHSHASVHFTGVILRNDQIGLGSFTSHGVAGSIKLNLASW